jgi:hypothetical protein
MFGPIEQALDMEHVIEIALQGDHKIALAVNTETNRALLAQLLFLYGVIVIVFVSRYLFPFFLFVFLTIFVVIIMILCLSSVLLGFLSLLFFLNSSKILTSGTCKGRFESKKNAAHRNWIDFELDGLASNLLQNVHVVSVFGLSGTIRILNLDNGSERLSLVEIRSTVLIIVELRVVNSLKLLISDLIKSLLIVGLVRRVRRSEFCCAFLLSFDLCPVCPLIFFFSRHFAI